MESYVGAVVIGKTISHYKVLKKLGEGGMGEVYLAEDTSLDRKVALKFLPPRLQNDEIAHRRFLLEAKSAAAIDHPYICNIFEVGQSDGGQDFIVMEYVEGQTLKDRLAEGQLPIKEALQIGSEVAEALEQAHTKGVVHRDLKPSNIMLTPTGHAKVLDFGLAKRITRDKEDLTTVLTREGTIFGTLVYMSPEQLRGSTVDTRSDIFSLGVVLYEMLTGVHPFRTGTQAETVNAILSEHPSALSSYVRSVPQLLQHTVGKMLAKAPDQRYQSIHEVRTNLHRQLEVGHPMSVKVEEPSIAVLPFVDMSPKKDQEYFCEGMAEELINGLTGIEGLWVASRTSSFQFKGKGYDIRCVGEELKVQTVLEGSVRKAGNKLRITAQLVNAGGGYHLWSGKYDREMEDIFAIQDEISLAIVENLRVRLLGREKVKLTKRSTKNQKAYETYLKGRYFWFRRYELGFQKALECFEKAVNEDPYYALAHVGIADTFNSLGFFGLVPPEEAFPRARTAAKRALEIDENLGEAHSSLGWVSCFYDWDWVSAEREYLRALELNPSYALGHMWYALFLVVMGRFEEALLMGKRSLELEPLSLIGNALLGLFFHCAGYRREALEQYRKTTDMDPNFLLAQCYLGLALSLEGLHEEANRALEKVRTSEDLPGYALHFLGFAYAISGQHERAAGVIEQLRKLSKQRYVSPYNEAMIQLALGFHDRCFELVDDGFRNREPQLALVAIYSALGPASIREDPRFKQTLRKLNMPEDAVAKHMVVR